MPSMWDMLDSVNAIKSPPGWVSGSQELEGMAGTEATRAILVWCDSCATLSMFAIKFPSLLLISSHPLGDFADKQAFAMSEGLTAIP